MDSTIALPRVKRNSILELIAEAFDKLVDLFHPEGGVPVEMKKYKIKSNIGKPTTAIYMGKDEEGNYEFTYLRDFSISPRLLTIKPRDAVIRGRKVDILRYRKKVIDPLEDPAEAEYLMSYLIMGDVKK